VLRPKAALIVSKRLTESRIRTRAGGAPPGAASCRLPGRRLDRHDRLGAADDPAFLLVDAQMMGEAAAFGVLILMGEGGRLAGDEQAVDGAPRRAAPFGTEPAEQIDQGHPPARLLAEADLAGEGRAELDRR
jgi:hypothetical protein